MSTEEQVKEQMRAEVRARLSREDSEYIDDFYERHRDATLVIDSFTGLPVEAVYETIYKEHVGHVRPVAELLAAIRLARAHLEEEAQKP